MTKKILALLLPLTLVACKEEVQIYLTEPIVTIEAMTPEKDGQYTVSITPDQNTFRYTFATAKGNDIDIAKFENGGYEGQRFVPGSEGTTVSYDGLSDGDAVIAMAYGTDGVKGPMAVHMVKGMAKNMTLESTYVTDCSLGFKIDWPDEYSRCQYYLGERSDREAFMKGELEATTLEDYAISDYYLNAFDLDPNTEYVLYARGWDRKGVLKETHELAVSTYADGKCPKVEMRVDYVDVYKADLTFTSNDKSAAIITMPSWEAPEQGISVRNGDILGAMDSYIAEMLWGKMTTTEHTQKRTELNSMYVDSVKYFYVQAVDAAGKRYLYRTSYKTPSYNPEAKSFDVSIKVSNILSYGATYEVNCGDDAFAFVIGTVKAGWYDSIKDSPEYDDTYIHRYLWQNGGRLVYKDDLLNGGVYMINETRQVASTRVYAVVCPINENGYGKGFLPPVFKEYTTLARN